MMKGSKKTDSTPREPYLLRGKSATKENSSTNMDAQSDVSDVATRSNIQALSDMLVSRLDSLSANISYLKKEVDTVQATINDLKVFNTHTSERVDTLENQIVPEINKAVQSVRDDTAGMLLAMEIHDRKQNLLLYGVKEEKGENVQEKVKLCFKNIGIPEQTANSIALVNAHRLPR